MYFKESGAITMNRFLKSQEHFMKCLGLVLLFGLYHLVQSEGVITGIMAKNVC